MIRTQPHRGGWLEVVCGPMFSGKSEELIRRLRRAEIAGQRALIVKPLVDDRFDVGHVVSHAGAKMRAVTAVSGSEVLRLAGGYDGDRDRRGAVLRRRDRRGDRRRSSGGARAWSRPASPRTSAASRSARCRRLLCVAEFVDKLEAVCHRCGGPATLTQRLLDGRPAPFDGATVQIGALDSYEARCRSCHSLSEPAWATARRATG